MHSMVSGMPSYACAVSLGRCHAAAAAIGPLALVPLDDPLLAETLVDRQCPRVDLLACHAKAMHSRGDHVTRSGRSPLKIGPL
jgi:hypothetical protein